MFTICADMINDTSLLHNGDRLGLFGRGTTCCWQFGADNSLLYR